MQRIIMKMWNSFGDTKWNGLIASIPDRIKAVIKSKGWTNTLLTKLY